MLKKFIRTHDKITASIRRASFYVRRLRAERVTKQVVTIVAAFALVLQLTGGLFPFASTNVNALGDDNIIRNGITSKEQLLTIYDNGTDGAGHSDIKQIYSHFGVSRQDIANATAGSYKTNDFNGQLKTIGRSNFPNTGRAAVAVEGAGTSIYAGPFLDNAGNSANSTPYVMQALIGKRSIDGQWFAITLNCGNIVYAVTPPSLPKPVAAVCTSLTATRTSRTNFKFNTKYTLGDDTFKSITYVISDATGNEITQTSSATYTQMTAGTYTVKAIVNVADAEGKAKTITSDSCATQFTVLPAVTPSSTSPKKCTIPGKEDLTEKSPNCKEDKKCTVAGKETLNADDKNCKEVAACTVEGKENLQADSPNCVEDKATPPAALPQTGLSENALKITGLGSIIASVGYYIASRRGLLDALMNR